MAKNTKTAAPDEEPKKTPIVQTATVHCPRCNSTKRGDYFGVVVQEFSGEYNGAAYTHIVRRRTACGDCGQVRIERAYENRGEVVAK